MNCFGFDTSNYTTSFACYLPAEERMLSEHIMLRVDKGGMGLRQSDAVFEHVRNLPEIVKRLSEAVRIKEGDVIAASLRPRSVEDSYMPCFLAGTAVARSLAELNGLRYMEFSHQEGHIAAALWSADRVDLLKQPHLAWHLSGGTTELLYVTPSEGMFAVKKLGGTLDISAGQAIDRAGVTLGLSFPAGAEMDRLACLNPSNNRINTSVKQMSFNLSGIENKTRNMFENGLDSAHIAAFVFNTILGAVILTTQQAVEIYGSLPVLFSGGVSSSSYLRERLSDRFQCVFGKPEFSSDNAAGIAMLAYLSSEGLF